MPQYKRLQIADPLENIPGLEPQARQVDTMVRPVAPQDPSKGLGGQLVTALGLTSSYAQKQEEVLNLEAEKEARVAYEQYKVPFAKAVKDGLITPTDNPFYIREWQKQELRLQAHSLDQFLRDEYSKDESIRATQDPTAIATWQQDKRQQWLNQNLDLQGYDITVLAESFFPLVEQKENAFIQQHAARRQAAIEEAVEQNSMDEIGVLVRETHDANGMIDGALLAEHIAKINDPMVAASRNPTAANHSTVDAIITEYKNTGDAGLIDALGKIPTSPGNTLGGTEYAKEQVRQANDYLENRYQDRVRWSEYQHKTRLTRERTKLLTEALPVIINQPNSPTSYQYVEAMMAVDPDAAQNLASYIEQRRDVNYKVRENRGLTADLYAGMMDGRYDESHVLRYAALNQIASPQEALRFLQNVRSETGRTVTQDRRFTDSLNMLGKAVETALTNPMAAQAPMQGKVSAAVAKQDLRRWAMTALSDFERDDGSFDREGFFDAMEERSIKMMINPIYGHVDKDGNPQYGNAETVLRPPSTLEAEQEAKQTPEGGNEFDQFDTQ